MYYAHICARDVQLERIYILVEHRRMYGHMCFHILKPVGKLPLMHAFYYTNRTLIICRALYLVLVSQNTFGVYTCG